MSKLVANPVKASRTKQPDFMTRQSEHLTKQLDHMVKQTDAKNETRTAVEKPLARRASSPDIMQNVSKKGGGMLQLHENLQNYPLNMPKVPLPIYSPRETKLATAYSH